jgi:hypothetical protein
MVELDSMSSCVHKHGFTQENLLQNLIFSAADGASCMLERKKGVTALLVEMFLLSLFGMAVITKQS